MSPHPRSGFQRYLFLLPTVATAATIVLTSGCEFDSQGNAIPPAPQLGCYNLVPSGPTIDTGSTGAGAVTDLLQADEPFTVRWNVCYDKGAHQDPMSSGVYVTRIQIFLLDEDGHTVELPFDEFVDSPSIDTDDCRDESVEVTDGLPAGNYRVYVMINNDGSAVECPGIPQNFSNWLNMTFTVGDAPNDGFDSTSPDSGDDAPTPPRQLRVGTSDSGSDPFAPILSIFGGRSGRN